MTIPDYILKEARAYAEANGGSRKIEDAFLAGFRASRTRKKNERVLTVEESNLFEQCWKAYGRKGSKKSSLERWKELSSDEMQKVMPHLRVYVNSREFKFQKDFERYLSNKLFNDIVTDSRGSTIFEPITSNNEYRPLTDDFFQTWDAENNCLRFNGDIDHLSDGYTDDNRPDGAKVAWGMYEWIWKANFKQWIKQ